MYGIDVSTYQSTLDMNDVRDAGNEFVGIKAVAAYRPNLLVAENYHHNTDRVMAAGLPKYPYAVPNNQNTPEATAQFCIENWYRRGPNDCYMLDNEPLDAYGVFWGDDEVYRYWTEMRTLGFDLQRGIEYCPAALTRSRGRWSKLIQLREEWGLKIQWVSYGDNDPYYEDGEEPFTGSTGLDNPEMHQFTSSYTIPGYGGLIDRVHSRLTVAELFGGAMPRTPSGAFAWAAHEAANGNVLRNWAGWCEKFINNAGAFNQGFGSAMIAGSNSGPLRGDYENAGIGAIIYWGGVGGDGHDAFVYTPGPDPMLLMASSSVDINWGHNIGLIRLSRYQEKFGHPLRGWTYRHGTETLDRSGIAGGGGIPIEEDDMYTDADRARDNNTAGFLWAGGVSAADPDYWGIPGTVYAMLKAPVQRSPEAQPTLLGEGTTNIPQVQDNADTNTIVRQLAVQVVALRGAVEALSTLGGVDPAVVKESIESAIHAAFAELAIPTEFNVVGVAKAAEPNA